MPTVRFEVEFDSKGAVAGITQLTDAISRIPAKTKAASEAAKAAAEANRKLSQEQKRASDAAQLLGNQLGIQLPGQVQKFIGSTKLIGPALATAFNASIFLALGAALLEALTNMDKLTDKLFDWSGQLKEGQERLVKVNVAMVEHVKQLKEMRRERALIGFSNEELASLRKDLQTRANMLRELNKQPQATGMFPWMGPPALSALFQSPTEAAKGVKALTELLPVLGAAVEDAGEKVATAGKKLEQFKVAALATVDLRNTIFRQFEQFSDRPLGFGLPIGLRPPGEPNTVADLIRIVEKQTGDPAKIASLNDFLAQSTAAVGDAFSEDFDLVMRITDESRDRFKKMAEDAQQAFERTAQTIEQFLDRAFLSTRSFSDVWLQLWMQSVSSVIKQFARLAAGWWHSQGAMAGNPGSVGALSALAAGGGGGGGFGGFGGGFNLFGGRRAGGTARTGAATSGGGFAELEEFASMQAASTGGVTGGASGKTLLGLGGRGLALGTGITGLVGAQLAAFGINRGSPTVGGLGGLLAGGAAGFALSAAGLLGSSAFALGLLGPTIIGAGIAGAIGIILAARNRGKQKRETASIHEQYLFAAERIIQDFERHRIGYDPAVGSLTQLYDATVQSLTRFGGPGRRTISEITGKYQGSLRRLDDIQAIREGRLTTISGLQIPSFQVGGISRGGLAFLARLYHPGGAIFQLD